MPTVLLILYLNIIPYRGIYTDSSMETPMKGHTITHSENIPRLSRVEGQIKGVKRMIEDGEYCIDIITQIQAARAALQSVKKNILEKHLKHCVADALAAHDEPAIDQKLQEIMTVIKRMEK